MLFGKPCLWPRDTRHFVIFIFFTGSIECKFVIFAVFVKAPLLGRGERHGLPKAPCVRPRKLLLEYWRHAGAIFSSEPTVFLSAVALALFSWDCHRYAFAACNFSGMICFMQLQLWSISELFLHSLFGGGCKKICYANCFLVRQKYSCITNSREIAFACVSVSNGTKVSMQELLRESYLRC